MRMENDLLVVMHFKENLPAELEWEDVAWRVIDHPTPITREVDWLHPLITHPPERAFRQSGWRFIARPATGGYAQTFDVFHSLSGWRVCCVWN